MIPFVIIRKIFLSFAPMVLFYLLRKSSKDKALRKPHLSEFDKEKIVEGEIIDESSSNREGSS